MNFHKNLTVAALLVFMTAMSYGQITLTSQTTPQPGQQMVMGLGNNTDLSPGNSGANQTWDFSAVEEEETSSLNFFNPNEPDFPEANLAAQDDSILNFLKTSSEKIEMLGSSGFGEGDFFLPSQFVRFEPPMLMVPFPFTYQNTYESTSGFLVVMPFDSLGFGDGPGEELIKTSASWAEGDSVRMIVEIKQQGEVDGWGTLKLPGKEGSALRAQNIVTTTFTMEVKILAMSEFWQDASVIFGDLLGELTQPQTDTSYSWFTMESAFPTATLYPGDDEFVPQSFEWIKDIQATSIQPSASQKIREPISDFRKTQQIRLQLPNGRIISLDGKKTVQ